MSINILLLEETEMARDFQTSLTVLRNQNVDKLTPETMLGEHGPINRNQGDMEREIIMKTIDSEITKMAAIIVNMKNYTSIYKADSFHQSSFHALEQWGIQMRVTHSIFFKKKKKKFFQNNLLKFF